MSDAPAPAAGPAPANEEEKNLGMLCHLLALSGFIIPFGSILGPLIIWLVKKEGKPYVDYHGKESLNFQITVAIAVVVCIPLVFVLIGLLLLPLIGLAALIFTIMAGIAAGKGEAYRYPVALRLIK